MINWAQKLFGITQVFFFLGISLAVYFFYRKQKELEKSLSLKENSIDFRASIKRSTVFQNENIKDKEPLLLSSTFPTWQKSALSHEILNVPKDASKKQIELAYKKLFKKYHPDRYASLGDGFVSRAHQTILILQKARDEMLKKINL